MTGAGIMGLCATYALALRGHAVTLFDPKGFPADNASFMAGGMLAPYSEIEHLPEPFTAAALEGIAFWQKTLPSLEDKVEFHRGGSLLVAHRDDEYILDRLAAKLSAFEPVGAGEIAALEPALGGRFHSGIFLPQEAALNPQQAMKALANAASRHVAEAADIGDLQKEFDRVIDCRGYAAEADDKDLRGVKGEIVLVRNPEFALGRPVRLMHPRYPLYIVPRPDHLFVIGATVIESAGHAVTLKSALELLSAAYSLHPSFAESEIVGIRAGIRPAYPDNLPRIKIDGNVIRCNGLFRHGYLLAPVMAACVADWMAGEENEFMPLFFKGHAGRNAGESHGNHPQRTENKIKRRA